MNNNMNKVLLLSVGMFALGLDAYVIAGLLPAMGATFHTNPSQTGQAVSVFMLCYALAAPVFATILAGKSIRKVFLIALGIFTLANAASAMVDNLLWMLLARAAAGIGAGLFSPLAAAATGSLVEANKRGRALSLILGGMSLGTILGVPVGLVIARLCGWQWTLWLVTALGLFSIVSIILWFPDIPNGAAPTFRQRFSILTDRRVAATVGITVILSIASLGLYTYISSVLHDTVGIEGAGPYMWSWSIGGAIGCFTIGILIDWLGRPRQIMFFIIAIMAMALFSIPIVLHFALISYLPFVIWGTMGWAAVATQQHALLLLQPKNGTIAVALNSSANYLGSALGSAMGGVAMLAGLPASMLPVVAGCLVLAGLAGQLSLILSIDRTSIVNSVN